MYSCAFLYLFDQSLLLSKASLGVFFPFGRFVRFGSPVVSSAVEKTRLSWPVSVVGFGGPSIKNTVIRNMIEPAI